MAFCTKCGQKNSEESSFCEQCGSPLRTATVANSSPATATITIAAKPRGARMIAYAGGGMLALVAIAGGLYFALAPEAPSNASFARAIQRSIDAHPDAYRNRYCLDNFAYDKDPVFVNPYDHNTQQWLKVLADAGLYNAPETVTSGGGFFAQTQLRYTKTEAGKKATQTSRLCIADGIEVTGVTSFTSPQTLGNVTMSSAVAKLAYRNPMSWTQSESARGMLPIRGGDAAETFSLMLKDGKWEVASADTLRQNARVAKLEVQPKASSGGLFDKLKNLFSFGGGNPILGKWASNVMGVRVVNFEFGSDSMRSESGALKVHYQVEGNQVIVFPEGQAQGMIVRVIDKDHIALNMGLMDLTLTRVE